MTTASNVVRLPTAATRKPRNHRYVAQSRAANALRQAEPWPGAYMHHTQRKAEALAAELMAIEQTPALIAVSAILRCLDDATYMKVLTQLAPAINSSRASHRQALAAARASRLTIGQQVDLDAAFRRLNEEGAA